MYLQLSELKERIYELSIAPPSCRPLLRLHEGVRDLIKELSIVQMRKPRPKKEKGLVQESLNPHTMGSCLLSKK